MKDIYAMVYQHLYQYNVKNILGSLYIYEPINYSYIDQEISIVQFVCYHLLGSKNLFNFITISCD